MGRYATISCSFRTAAVIRPSLSTRTTNAKEERQYSYLDMDDDDHADDYRWPPLPPDSQVSHTDSSYIFPTPSFLSSPTSTLSYSPSISPSSPSTPSTLCPSTPSPSQYLRLADFHLILPLGHGSSGIVLLARYRPSGRLVALKIVRKHIARNVWVRGEQEAMRVARDRGVRGVVGLLGSFEEAGAFVMVLEYCTGKSLTRELKKAKRLSPARARFITASLIATLSDLHNVNILHRDVKPGNILFTASGEVVLADFGLSVVFGAEEYEQGAATTTGESGTWAFMAPEMFEGGSYGREVDFWAVGVLLYLMLTGKVPFGHRARCVKDVGHAIVHDALTFDRRVDAVTRDLLSKLLTKDPQLRLTHVEDIKAHPYFSSVDWTSFPPLPPTSKPAPPLEYAGETYVIPFKPPCTKWDGPEYPDFYYVSPELAHRDTFKGVVIVHSGDVGMPADAKYRGNGRGEDGSSDRRQKKKWYKRLLNA